MKVFSDKAQSDRCHIGFNFSDGSYMNIGISTYMENPDLGRFNQLLSHGDSEDVR